MRPNTSAIECVNSLLLGRYAPWGKKSPEKIGQRFPLPSLTMIGGNLWAWCRAAKRERERERKREMGLSLIGPWSCLGSWRGQQSEVHSECDLVLGCKSRS